MNRLRNFWFAPRGPERLAALRLLIGGYALGYVLSRLLHLISVAGHAASQFRPVGPVAWVLDQPLPPALVIAPIVATIVAGFAYVAGLRFRVSGPAFALLLLWTTSYRNSWGMVFHTENLMVLHVLVLGLSRSADVWSLDARGRAAPTAHARYGWPVVLLMTITVLTYFLAGWTKLSVSGLGWVTHDVLRWHVAYDNMRKAELGATWSPVGAWLAGHAWFFPPIAAASLAIEIGAPLALLSERVGRWWAAAAWSFHLGVLLIMAIMFHYPLTGVAFAPFFPLERWGPQVVRRIFARRGNTAQAT